MPHGEPDATDPMTLTGVEVVVDDGGAVVEMAACFIEEYFRMGLGSEAVLELFTSGEFTGPTMAFRQLGRERIRQMIEEQVCLRGPRGARMRCDQQADGTLNLPVLEN